MRRERPALAGEGRVLRAALVGLYEATRAYLDASALKRRAVLSEREAELTFALSAAFDALHPLHERGR